MSHAFVHIDIPAVDPKAAGEFYAKLFGWDVHTDETFNYTMFRPSEGVRGGFPKVEAKASGGGDKFEFQANSVLIYISTDDIEATLANAEELGAKTVYPKEEIPGTGWWGVFRDATGNNIGLFTPMPGSGM